MEAPPPPPPPVQIKKEKKPNSEVPLSNNIESFNRKKLKRVDDSLRGDAPDLCAHPGYHIGDDEDKQLYYDTEEEVVIKVKKLAELVKNSKQMVVYTGAGISTSADIPDYRSPTGVWEALSKGEKAKKAPPLSKVKPTLAHMSLSKLTNDGFLKFTVTTNLDGLHLRSGIPPNKLSELHGCAFKRYCKNCKKYFYNVPEQKWGKDKALEKIQSYICPNCSSRLAGTGVSFGSNLPQTEWNKAKEASETCDLALVLGTSLRVAPACNLVEKSYKNKGHLVICNLQKTPYDKYASLVIHANTDQVMTLLCKELGLPIPSPPKSLKLEPIDAIN